MRDILLLVDAYSLIYRAFYAIRNLTGPRGEPVNAIYGFTKMLRKLLTDHKPTHAAVVFDLGAPQKRLTLLPSYKAQRPPTPPDLEAQIPMIRNVLAAMRVPIVEIDGEEADDIIATLANQAARQNMRVLIASNDKDFAQIVGSSIQLLRPDGKETVIVDEAAVEARYGVKPEQIVDLLSLTGDAVDNIPGVPGVGEKTATELLRSFSSLDRLLARATEIVKPKLREAIISHADRVRLNRTLVVLSVDLVLPIQPDNLKLRPFDTSALTAIFQQLGFKSMATEMEKQAKDSQDLFALR